MMECKLCECVHENREEATAIHRATRSIHDWLSDRVRAAMLPPDVPLPRKNAAPKPDAWKS